jgi:hypothetical protein
MLDGFQYVVYTAIIHKTRPLPVALLYREKTVNGISYNKCTQYNAWCHLSQKFRNNLPERIRGRGKASSRRLMLKFHFIVLSEFRYPIRPK